ncbi:helix-turn-helix domain-containing protein [Clostridium sporogenes]|uniref:helix-turn-helix domain-containing protein n=1 Tax=Clostridium sporogenes TaxID=1509 RepID=UPI000717748F|nr:helix-turn-helix transcriptional regulator [Clostridium sporogenes]KRU40026.1 Cro/Cl-type HTH domain-containing protein [Clostridium sporogenes]MCW6065853.1 helix-turn-helix transcriptional regulator [Clostridium sporogenes]OQP88576.1 hypothetical protein VT93_0202200 [Clostridium sporogenes]UCA39364.1 helix-turn-helix transcriptional regulator [Clostridium sporogenes]
MEISKVNLEIEMAKAGVKSISQLSRHTGLSRHSLTKYCTIEGMENITLKNLLKICTVLNCKIEDVIEIE